MCCSSVSIPTGQRKEWKTCLDVSSNSIETLNVGKILQLLSVLSVIYKKKCTRCSKLGKIGFRESYRVNDIPSKNCDRIVGILNFGVKRFILFSSLSFFFFLSEKLIANILGKTRSNVISVFKRFDTRYTYSVFVEVE